MRKVRIDFAPPGLRRTLFHTPRAAWVLAWLCLSAGLLLVANGTRYLRQRDAFERLAHTQHAAHERTVPPASAPRVPPISSAQAAAVNAAVLQLNLPWRALRDAVREATPAGVALLALEPDARRRSLRITAEAKDSDAMLDYVAALGRGGWFGAVHVARHEIDERHPQRPLRFQVDAAWGGEGPP